MSFIFNVLNEGDSITEGHDCYSYLYGGVDITKVPDAVLAIGPRAFVFQKSDILSTYNGINRAVSGTRISDAVARAATTDAFLASNKLNPYPLTNTALTPSPQRLRKYIISIMFTNFDSLDPTTESTAWGNYALARRASGWDGILMGTRLPRGGTPGFEAFRLAFNVIVRSPSYQSTYGIDHIFDIGAEPIMGNAANLTDTTYYSDQIHPTSFPLPGQSLLSPIYGAALESILARF